MHMYVTAGNSSGATVRVHINIQTARNIILPIVSIYTHLKAFRHQAIRESGRTAYMDTSVRRTTTEAPHTR